MAQDDRQSAAEGGAPDDALTLLKKRARRRLIGAVAVALFAAIVLPLLMDHQPAPTLKDIQVRIPNPDEGAPIPKAEIRPIAKVEPQPAPSVATPAPAPEPTPPATAAKAADKPAAKPLTKPEAKSAAPAAVKAPPAEKPASKAVEKATPAGEAPAPAAAEAWEVQLGAYAEPARVSILLAKLKEIGLPAYTEKVNTPNGPRTRVRAGPFSSQQAAEKAKVRIRTIGVDGPVAKKS